MYKKMNLSSLTSIKNSFLTNLKDVYTKERCSHFKEFLKHCFKQGNKIYFFSGSKPILRGIKKDDQNFIFFDEQEKIEVELDNDAISQLNNLLKNERQIKKMVQNNKSIMETLIDAYQAGEYTTINGKPFLVYDIETTTPSTQNLRLYEFLIAYSINSVEKGKTLPFRFIDTDKITKFVQFLDSFDWYIVGFNNIWFDNPVSVYNTHMVSDQEQALIDRINKKSIDLFLFIRHLTGKRVWLNKVSNAFIGLQKTLESWAEWWDLFRRYKEENDLVARKTFKEYCKNDVKMTLLVLLYLMHYQKISLDEQEFSFSLDDLIRLWSQPKHISETEYWPDIWLF